MQNIDNISSFLDLDFFSPKQPITVDKGDYSEYHLFSDIDNFAFQHLEEFLSADITKNVNLVINSAGGSVFDGTGMAALMKQHEGNVTTTGIGFVASIASVILLAGDTVQMDTDAFLMIHNAWLPMTGGDANSLRKDAAFLDKISNQIANVYLAKVESNGKLINDSKEETLARIKTLMTKETWFNAEEAFEFGLIDEVVNKKHKEEDDKQKMLLQSVLNKYEGTLPEEALNKIKNNLKMSENTEKQSLWQQFKAFFVSEPEKAQALMEEVAAEQKEKQAKAIEEAKALLMNAGYHVEIQPEPVAEVTEEVTVESTEEVETLPEAVENIQEDVQEDVQTATEEVETPEEVQNEVISKQQEVIAQMQAQLKQLEQQLAAPAHIETHTEKKTLSKREQIILEARAKRGLSDIENRIISELKS